MDTGNTGGGSDVRQATQAQQPGGAGAFRRIRGFLGCYLALSALTVAATALLRLRAVDVTPAVWTRESIVLASAVATYAFAVRAGRGSRRALLRLRLVSAVMLAAIAVVVALPGAFPGWLRIEQAGCGLLLLPVVVLANSGRVRASVAER